MAVLYGIKNCDRVKKARLWLAQNAIDHTFHDFRSQGLAPALLDDWLRALDWELLLNRRGSTWRQLPAALKAGVDAATARGLMLDYPTLIKRPVLIMNGEHLVGFGEAAYRAFFSHHTHLSAVVRGR